MRDIEYWFEEDNGQEWWDGNDDPTPPYIQLCSSWEGEQMTVPYDQIDAVIAVLEHAKRHPVPAPHWEKVNGAWQSTAAGLAADNTARWA
jgi:hypothetical protein